MRLLAIFLPPVAVLLAGKPIQALLNLLLTLFFWIPGAIHAWGVVTDYQEDKRWKEREKKEYQMQSARQDKGLE